MRHALVAAVVLLPALASAQTTVYQNDFESGAAGAGWSGAGAVETTGGLSAFGFGASHLRNAGNTASVLTLGGLAPHTSMTLTFDLAMWDSIDWGDVFEVRVDGTTLFSGPFGNYFVPVPAGAPDVCGGPGTWITGPFVDFFTPDYGVSTYRDCGRAVSFTFAHSAPDAVFTFAYPGTQGGADESFGLDNVVVETNARGPGTTVPEPGTWALLATGLVGIATVRRRRVR